MADKLGAVQPFHDAEQNVPNLRGVVALLELFLGQNGAVAPIVQVFGTNNPAISYLKRDAELTRQVECVILAPTVDEVRVPGWLDHQAKQITAQLAAHGVVYVLAPPRTRRLIVPVLQRHGLEIETRLLYLPRNGVPHWLVPLDAATFRYAFANLITTSTLQRHLLAIVLHLPRSHSLFGSLLSSVALVFQRRGALPRFKGLFQSCGYDKVPDNVIIRTSWRGPAGPVILYCFSKGGTDPFAVGKIGLEQNANAKRLYEAAMLHRLGPGARKNGVQIPQLLQIAQSGKHILLLQSVVQGRSGADMLMSQPHLLYYLTEQIITWLQLWNQSTVIGKVIDHDQLQRDILAPAHVLIPLLRRGDEYLDWLTGRCLAVVGLWSPFVAAHNDLTMQNVIMSKRGQLSVIDWETACLRTWPLLDVFYAITDAVAATNNYADRLRAFRDCFVSDGPHTSHVSRLLASFCTTLAISSELVELCFHACWLHHAMNELNATTAAQPRPFLQIMQALALSPAYAIDRRGYDVPAY